MEQFADNGTSREPHVPQPHSGIGRRAFLQASLAAAAITVVDFGTFQDGEQHAATPPVERFAAIQAQPQIVMPRGFAMPSLLGNNMRLYKGRLS